jgi:hypothetical protein
MGEESASRSSHGNLALSGAHPDAQWVERGSSAGGTLNREAADMKRPRAERPRLVVCDERAEAASDFLVLALDRLFASRRPLVSCAWPACLAAALAGRTAVAVATGRSCPVRAAGR